MKSRSRKFILIVAATFYESDSNKINGKLKINKENIVFVASDKNSRLYKLVIPVADVIEIVKKSSYGIIPNLIIIKTNTTSYKFSLYAREHFIKTYEKIKSELL
jgi:hypothetical protein